MVVLYSLAMLERVSPRLTLCTRCWLDLPALTGEVFPLAAGELPLAVVFEEAAACEGCDECDARWPEADAGKRCAVCGWNNREFLTCMNPDSPRYATEIPPNATCACFELEVINGAEI